MEDNIVKVSVIIPAYNAAQYIESAIDSVLSQDYANMELIVCDDGSTDNTRELLKKYGSRITYLYQENQGCAAARNKAISVASGELIAFLDADDRWLANKLKAQVSVFKEKNDIALVFSDAYIKDINGAVVDNFFRISRPHRGIVFDRLVKENFIPILTAIVRKDVLDKVGLFDTRYKITEDWDMLLRISRRHQIDYIDSQLAEYRVHSANICRNKKLMLRECIDILNGYLEGANNRTRTVLRNTLSLHELAFGLVYLKEGKNREAREYFLKSVEKCFFNFKAYMGFIGTYLPRATSDLFFSLLKTKNMHD